jgi:NhaP-type Na+/H+ or K+/H+ antiporter
MVVKQYRARGIVTDTLLPVVALDDAIGLMVFSICVALAKVFAVGEQLTFMSTVVTPLLEIALSLVVGAALGALLALCMRFFRSRANRLCLMIVAVLAGVGLSEMNWPMGLSLSSLLTCMMTGAVFANMRKDSLQILDGTENWTPPLYMLFFVISGAELDLKVIPLIGIAGVAYIVFRSMGKYLGAFTGAAMVKADKNVRNYLGLTLPQAGVAIGMAQVVANTPEFAAQSSQIVTIVLCATLVYELVGPLITKIALVKSGEIEKTPKRAKKAKSAQTACTAVVTPETSTAATAQADTAELSNNNETEK